VPFNADAARRHHIPKQRHRVTNWAEYDAALRQRGSLTIWFTEEAIAAWRAEPRTTRGGQPHDSALAIRMTLVAIVDGIERLPGIGAKTALAIRVELGRIALLDVQSP
jgi:Transposase DDE domain